MKNLKDIGFSGYAISRDGEVYSLKSHRFLKGWVNSCGYRTFALTDDTGVVHQNVNCHRLMAKVFIPNNDSQKSQVNHLDGNKLNNNLKNLEWCTPRRNTRHFYLMGLRKPAYVGKDNKTIKSWQIKHDWRVPLSIVGITEEDVHNVCQHLQEGYRVCDVSAMLAIDRRFIQHLRDNQKPKWRHIVEKYDFSRIKRRNKLSVEKVIQICKELEKGKGILEVSRVTNVHRKKVSYIKNRKFYRDISSAFDF